MERLLDVFPATGAGNGAGPGACGAAGGGSLGDSSISEEAEEVVTSVNVPDAK